MSRTLPRMRLAAALIVGASARRRRVALVPSQRRAPGAQPQPAAVPFRAGVELVSLNVTVTDGTARYVTDLEQDGLPGLRGRRQAGRHLLQPHQPADRARAAARHQRQHGDAAADGAGSGGRLRAAAAAAGPRRSHRLRQPRRRSCSRSPTTSTELEQAIRKTSAGGSTSLYNAIYIALKDLKKVDGRRTSRRSAARRSSCSPTARTRRACCRSRRCSIWPSDRRRRSTRSACASRDEPRASKGFKEAEFVLRQLAQETGGRAFFPNADRRAGQHLRPDRRRAVEPVHASATRRRTRRATARGGGSSFG